MGQTLQKATKLLKGSPNPKASAPKGWSFNPVQKSVEIKPAPVDPKPIIEPGEELGDWDRSDPKYSAMVQQVVGKIITRPGGKQEMGEAVIVNQYRRAMPINRHTTAETGPDEDVIRAPGTLNIAHIREIFLLYHGLKEGQDKPMDAKILAEKYKVDFVLLEKIFCFYSLPNNKESVHVASELESKSLEG